MHLTFKENCVPGLGTLVINNVAMSHRGYDPLAKIWSKLKKCIRKKYGVDVTGIFTYNDEREVISCSFCLNYGAPGVHSSPDTRIYTKRFEETFPLQMLDFEEILEAFVESPDGLEKYEELVTQKATATELSSSIKKFLSKFDICEA